MATMKLEKINIVRGLIGFTEERVSWGKYCLHSDALAYAADQVKEAKRWRDPEKEKPEHCKDVLIKLQDSFGIDEHSVGFFNDTENKFTIYDLSVGDLKVIGWKEIE